MDYKKIFYPESGFGGFSDIDGTIIFYSRVNSLLSSDSVVLDVGCGRGGYGEDKIELRRSLRVLKGKCRKVIGIDVDADAAQNPFIDEFRRLNLDDPKWPVETGSIDICLADNVLEHVSNPDGFWGELNRVLKPGGVFCFRTPNVLGYVSLIAKMIPEKYHQRLIKKGQPLRKEMDVFPAYYRCNTSWKIRALMRRHGFEGSVKLYEAEPSYLNFSKIAYCIGVLYQRLAPSIISNSIFGFVRKT